MYIPTWSIYRNVIGLSPMALSASLESHDRLDLSPPSISCEWLPPFTDSVNFVSYIMRLGNLDGFVKSIDYLKHSRTIARLKTKPY